MNTQELLIEEISSLIYTCEDITLLTKIRDMLTTTKSAVVLDCPVPSAVVTDAPPVKRGPGRPRKNPLPVEAPKKTGRPKKSDKEEVKEIKPVIVTLPDDWRGVYDPDNNVPDPEDYPDYQYGTPEEFALYQKYMEKNIDFTLFVDFKGKARREGNDIILDGDFMECGNKKTLYKLARGNYKPRYSTFTEYVAWMVDGCIDTFWAEMGDPYNDSDYGYTTNEFHERIYEMKGIKR